MKQKHEIEKRKREIESHLRRVLIAALFILMIFSEPLADTLLTKTELHSVFAMAENEPLAIYYPYTGNSGCTLIHCESAVVLIDCGRGRAQFDFGEFLELTNTNKIDLAVLTHPDTDHLNMFTTAVQNVPIGKFITCEYSTEDGSAAFSELEAALSAHGIQVETAHAGNSYIIGALKLDVLSPASVYKDSNNNSLVTRMTYGDFTALFMGDAAARAEKNILSSGADASADLLTVSHHGSAGATSEEFLSAVSPKYAVIMTSESRYLPSGEAIARLADFGCEIYRTDVSGTIAVCSDGTPDGIQIFTDR